MKVTHFSVMFIVYFRDKAADDHFVYNYNLLTETDPDVFDLWDKLDTLELKELVKSIC